MREKISIITPSYNSGPYLKLCLESVANQNCETAKHYVMDGGSTDETIAILKSFDKSHSNIIWKSEPDKGQSDALNKAFSLINGDIIGWLNADDVYAPGAFNLALNTFRNNPKAVIVYGDYLRIDPKGKVICYRRQPSFNFKDCLYSYLTVLNCAAFFSTKAIRTVGGWDNSLRFAMDYDLVLKLAEIGQVVKVPHILGAFRIHPTSKTSTMDDVCQKETQEVRTKHAKLNGLPNPSVYRYFYHKTNVLRRMLLEGCLPSRVLIKSPMPFMTGWFKDDHN